VKIFVDNYLVLTSDANDSWGQREMAITCGLPGSQGLAAHSQGFVEDLLSIRSCQLMA